MNTDKSIDFQIGDVVVSHLDRGVGKISGFQTKDQEFIVASFKTGTLYIPLHEIPLFIRKPISKEIAEETLALLRGNSSNAPLDRQSQLNILKGTSFSAKAEILRSLYGLKELSGGDRIMIGQLEGTILAEIGHVLGISLQALVGEMKERYPR
jgi:RNA polymerase-interacting CarD/CdnL/TRCF family regulator